MTKRSVKKVVSEVGDGSDASLIQLLEKTASTHRFGVLCIAALVKTSQSKKPTERKFALRILRMAHAGAISEHWQQFLLSIM